MSDLSDPCDFATAREEEIRGDALGEVTRKLAEQASVPSAFDCCVCAEEIPQKRRESVPGVQTCVACQEEIEAALAMRGL